MLIFYSYRLQPITKKCDLFVEKQDCYSLGLKRHAKCYRICFAIDNFPCALKPIEHTAANKSMKKQKL